MYWPQCIGKCARMICVQSAAVRCKTVDVDVLYGLGSALSVLTTWCLQHEMNVIIMGSPASLPLNWPFIRPYIVIL